MIKVIVNDVPLDLKSDAVIALTRKVADIGALQSRFSSFTNKFQVKATKKNRDALGLKQYQDTSDSISAGIATPYQELTGKLISNGIEIATNVAVIIESVADDITLSIRAGNGSLFDKLNRTKLSALDYSDIDLLVDSRYNLGNVYDFRNNDWTQSFVYPIHDTGVQSTKNFSVYAKGLVPFYYVKDIYQRIAALFGYSWTGSTFTSDFFEKLMIPAARFDITNDFASQFVMDIDFSNSELLVGYGGPESGRYVFDNTINSDPFNLMSNYNITTYYGDNVNMKKYAAPFVGNYTFEFSYTSSAKKNIDAPAYVEVAIIEVRGNPSSDTFVSGSTDPLSNAVYRAKLYDLTVPFGVTQTTVGTHTGEFACNNANENESVNTTQYFLILASFNCEIFINPPNILVSGNLKIVSVRAEQTTWNRWLQWANHLPDITIAKFIKEVGNIFGAVYDVDEFRKEIEITRLDEIATNRDEAVDWSDKLDLSNPHEVTYIVDGIGKTTSWQWKKTDDYTYSVSVINEQLPENENYVKSDAEYSEERSILLMQKPSMFFPVWDESARRINLNGDLRFAIARTEMNLIVYSPSLNSVNSKVAYFDYDNSPYSLDWSRLYSEYYQGLFEPMTWYMNKVVADFKLNDLDIQSFKFKYPVYIKHFNRYFYVNEISEYTGKDQSTKCTLIAI